MIDILNSNSVATLALLEVVGTFLFLSTFLGGLRLSGKIQ